MTRFHAWAAALLVGEVLVAGCSHGAAPRGITEAGVRESATSHSRLAQGSVSAGPFVNEVRLGHGLDTDGKVPPGIGASKFAVGDPIHLSLWQVTEERAGSVVRVSVRYVVTNHVVWSGEKWVPPGGTYLSFGIGGELARGLYQADVIIGEDVVSRTDFEVRDWKE